MEFYFVITVLFVFFLFFFMFSFVKKLTVEDGHEESNKIINHFDPDNYAPTLGQMIAFHKDKGIVEYDI